MISKNLEDTLSAIFLKAKEKQYDFITIEHLLLGLIDDLETKRILVQCGANLTRLRATLDIYIEETTPKTVAAAVKNLEPTQSFQRVLQRAIDQVRIIGREEVSGPNVLMALYDEKESQAVYFLHQENVALSDVRDLLSVDAGQAPLSRKLSGNIDFSFNVPSSSFDNKPTDNPFDQATPTNEELKEQEIIAQYTTNLNQKAKMGKVDPLIGRDGQVERVVEILCRRRKNNPILIGEAGVGKTAIAEGLAKKIVDKKVPSALKNVTIYELDLAILIAGTKYRGDFEKRFKTVLNALNSQKNAVVFIDEIHNIVGAGSATGSTMDASNLLKPLLSSGEIRCIGATTYDEYRTYIEKDPALLRRFQKIDVEEPSAEEAFQILQGLQGRFEEYHKVKYSDAALKCAVELSKRYITDRQLPDKAIDIIDEAGAFEKTQDKLVRKTIIDVAEIERVIAKITRIPVEKLNEQSKQVLKNLPDRLASKVFGQNHAINLLSDAIKLTHAGLRSDNKPMGSFLFAGPTGVGKTEVVKQLADELSLNLIRLDMSEYSERHTVSRLIGAPPGYVGYEQAGLLTEAVIKNPHSIVLLDEIEKAHPDIFNILLQVMDNGFLTDNNGRKADFRHTMLVMTSNVGADSMEKNSLGFATNDEQFHDRMQAVKSVFTPEFRNRLDAVVPFNALSPEIIVKVVDKCVHELEAQLSSHNVAINLSESARQWLAEKGYSRAMGARPMDRLIRDEIKKPLAEQLLFGSLSNGHAGTVHIGLVEDKLVIEIVNSQAA